MNCNSLPGLPLQPHKKRLWIWECVITGLVLKLAALFHFISLSVKQLSVDSVHLRRPQVETEAADTNMRLQSEVTSMPPVCVCVFACVLLP